MTTDDVPKIGIYNGGNLKARYDPFAGKYFLPFDLEENLSFDEMVKKIAYMETKSMKSITLINKDGKPTFTGESLIGLVGEYNFGKTVGEYVEKSLTGLNKDATFSLSVIK